MTEKIPYLVRYTNRNATKEFKGIAIDGATAYTTEEWRGISYSRMVSCFRDRAWMAASQIRHAFKWPNAACEYGSPDAGYCLDRC